MLISIIIIFFNEERFLQEAIESVLCQSYKNWELLLVNDGSTDNSINIAQKYVTSYPNQVQYLEHKNQQNKGKSSSRNLGINNAKGEYIAFLDADDMYLPSKLKNQIAILQSCPEAAMVYGNTLYWYSWTNHPEDMSRDYMPNLGINVNQLIPPPSLLLLLLGEEGATPCICSFLVKRNMVQQLGGFDESIQHLYEDQVFLAKIFANSTVFVEDGCGEKYRQRNDSSWHLSLSTGQDEKAHLIFLKWLNKYLKKEQIEDKRIWEALNQQLNFYRHHNSWAVRIKLALKSIFSFVKSS